MAHRALNERIDAPRSLHAVDRMMRLALAAGGEPVIDLRLHACAKELAGVDAEAELLEPYLVLAPTSVWPGKRWDARRFAELGTRALDDASFGVERLVVVGGPGEREQIGEPLLRLMDTDPRVTDLVGKTSVGRLLAVCARARAIVANDSATLHMGVGLGRPLVALFGPTRVELVGPYGRSDCLVQHLREGDTFAHKDRDIGRAMMERIGVDEALERLGAQLAAPTAPPVYRILNPSASGADAFEVELDDTLAVEPARVEDDAVEDHTNADRA